MTSPVGYCLASTPTMRRHGRTPAQALFHPPYACRVLQVLERLRAPGRSPQRAYETAGEDKMKERKLDPEVEQVRTRPQGCCHQLILSSISQLLLLLPQLTAANAV